MKVRVQCTELCPPVQHVELHVLVQHVHERVLVHVEHVAVHVHVRDLMQQIEVHVGVLTNPLCFLPVVVPGCVQEPSGDGIVGL